jgi:hypothetical protein
MTTEQRAMGALHTISTNSEWLVQPSLVAIYRLIQNGRSDVEHVGTGFLLTHKNRPLLVTAKHSLYGPKFDQDVGDKAIFAEGQLLPLGAMRFPEVFNHNQYDLAAMFVDELATKPRLPSSALCKEECTARLITIHGYLVRDFKREAKAGVLRPAPRIYTNVRRDWQAGYVGLRYPRAKNRETDTGMKTHAPIPSGLSGCPMMDGEMLAAGQVRILGVFTTYESYYGTAYGEHATKIIEMMSQI